MRDAHDARPITLLREGHALLQSHPAVAIGMITTAELARVLGRSNARAARDWCQRHGISYRRDGKHNWVCLADVQRVLGGLPVRDTHLLPRDHAAEVAVAALVGRR